MTTKITTTAEQRNIIAKLLSNDSKEFTTIRISRGVYNDLSKRGRYKDTHSDIIARLLEDTGSNLEVPEDQRSW
jgi:hypothetical protein